MRRIRVTGLGLTAYRDVLALQRELQARRREAGGRDWLLLTEHQPVITLGRTHPEPSLRVPASDVAGRGIEIVQTERGGDITYHGPGQLVAYGIIDLKAWGLGVIDYVTGLEEAVILTCADFGVTAGRRPAARGAWVGERKVASVGVNVRRWVTMHGIALNVRGDEAHWALIEPCGMTGVDATSIAAESHGDVLVPEVAARFRGHFADVFGCVVDQAEAPNLPSAATV